MMLSESEKKTRNVPQLRFAGFTNEWEKRKFKDFISKAGAKNKNDEDFPAYSVNNRLGLVFQTEQFDGSRLDGLDKSAYKLVYPDEFVYNPARINVGSIAYNDLGKTVIVSSLYVILHMSEKIDNGFALTYIKSSEFLNEVRRNTEGSVREYLFYENFRNVKLPYTADIHEQKKIGDFFKQLDILINLHQHNLNLLEEKKKGYLQKMFPKKGKKEPELRFSGYTGAWEQRKLGEYSSYRRGSFPQPYGNKEWYGGKNAMPFVQVVDVDSNLSLVNDTKQKISELAQPKSVFVTKGTVLVTLQGSIGRVAITQYDCYVDRTLLIFNDYKKETDKNFWAYTIQKKFEIEKRKAPGGTIKTITKEALSSFDVKLPNYEEQKKIGSFFERLDDLITLHQGKLDGLKERKKAYLQKMFV